VEYNFKNIKYMNGAEIEKVAKELNKRFSKTVLNPSSNYDWKNPSLNILDCVLSLNRRYYEFAKPRVDMFKENNPGCFQIEDLISIIQKYKCNYGEFTIKELDYNHAERGRIIYEVAQFLLKEISKYDDGKQMAKLEKWAKNTKPENVSELKIKGFGLSGFQYLRMLFGAQTAKPDVHIRNYLSDIIGRNLSDVAALNLLEKAAAITGLPLRELDYEIWMLQSGTY
jgi:hypothetical protein